MLTKRLHHTLYLSAHGAIAITHQPSGERVTGRFENIDETSASATNEPAGETQIGDNAALFSLDFDSWISERSKDIFTLVVDHVDEQQSVEEIPRLSSRDRNALIARRITQRFRDSDLHTYRRIGSKRNGRKWIDQIAIGALKNSVNLSPWLDVLLERRVRIRRITSPTLLAWPLIAKVAPGQTGLLVSRTPAGLRQTLLVNGNVRFSRLAGMGAITAAEVVVEIQRSLQYLLMTQRLVRADIQTQGLSIWLVDEGIQNVQNTPAHIDLGGDTKTSVKLLNAQSADLPSIEHSGGLSVWAGIAQRHRGTLNYADARVTRFERIAQWHRRLWTGGATICAIGLAMAALGNQLLGGTNPDDLLVRTETRKLNATLNELRELRASLPATPDDLVSAPQLATRLRAHAPDAAHITTHVSQAFASSHGLQLRGLGFQPADALQVDLPPDFSNNAEPMQPSLLEPDLRISLLGTTAATLTRTEANTQIQELADRLTRSCFCALDSVTLAFDPSPETGMTGRIQSGDDIDTSANTANGFEIVWLQFRSASRQQDVAQAAGGTDASLAMAPMERPR